MYKYEFNFNEKESILFENAVKLAEKTFSLEMPKCYEDWLPMHLFAINEILCTVSTRCHKDKAFQTMFTKVQRKTLFRFIESLSPISEEQVIKSFNNVLEQYNQNE